MFFTLKNVVSWVRWLRRKKDREDLHRTAAIYLRDKV